MNVPSAGTYTMTIRYANGGATTSTQGLAYDGGAWSTVSYPPTGSWDTFGPTVTLTAGSNVIRLAMGSPDFAGGTGYARSWTRSPWSRAEDPACHYRTSSPTLLAITGRPVR